MFYLRGNLLPNPLLSRVSVPGLRWCSSHVIQSFYSSTCCRCVNCCRKVRPTRWHGDRTGNLSIRSWSPKHCSRRPISSAFSNWSTSARAALISVRFNWLSVEWSTMCYDSCCSPASSVLRSRVVSINSTGTTRLKSWAPVRCAATRRTWQTVSLVIAHSPSTSLISV